MRAASLADMDSFEVSSRKRRPRKLSNATNNMRSVNVIMWTRVDGSAVVAAHPRRSAECCTNALWRRMLCACNVGRIKAAGQGHHDNSRDACRSDSDLELGEPQKARMLPDVGAKLQTAFGMRRWPQGWI